MVGPNYIIRQKKVNDYVNVYLLKIFKKKLKKKIRMIGQRGGEAGLQISSIRSNHT